MYTARLPIESGSVKRASGGGASGQVRCEVNKDDRASAMGPSM